MAPIMWFCSGCNGKVYINGSGDIVCSCCSRNFLDTKYICGEQRTAAGYVNFNDVIFAINTIRTSMGNQIGSDIEQTKLMIKWSNKLADKLIDECATNENFR